VGETISIVDNRDRKLLPNVNVGVTIVNAQRDNVLVVPREAVRMDDSKPYVLQVVGINSNGRMWKRPSQISRKSKSYAGSLSTIWSRSVRRTANRSVTDTGQVLNDQADFSSCDSSLPFFLSLSAMADSPKDMLQAGRVDDAINALNGQLASNPHDAAAIHLLCRAYFQYEIGTARKDVAREQLSSSLTIPASIGGWAGCTARRPKKPPFRSVWQSRLEMNSAAPLSWIPPTPMRESMLPSFTWRLQALWVASG